jgi:hypothetical protein
MTYQAGDRVALVHTSDPHTRLTPGTAGTVTGYDHRHGQLHVAWDDGSSLSMLLRDGDQVHLLDPPQTQTRQACAADSAATTSSPRPGHRGTSSPGPGSG